jgi:transglutaminase-like putative cysteine protease
MGKCLRKSGWFFFSLLLLSSWTVSRAAAADWEPVTDAERSMTTNPLDPGAGAVVVFKRGDMSIRRQNASLWETRIITYTRIKVLTEAGQKAGNVSFETPKFLRLSKIEGRTILPSGEIVPLDTSKVFRSVAYQAGKDFAVLATSFAFSSVQPGAILEYQTEQYVDWFFPSPWIFDTCELGTLQSTLRVVVGDDLAMDQLPMDTTANMIHFSQKHVSTGQETDYSVENLRPLRAEPFQVPFYDRAVMVLFDPTEFLFSDRVYPVIKTWNDVAGEVTRRFNAVNKSNHQSQEKAKDLAAELSDPRKKAEAIYRYLQQNITSSNLGGFVLGRTVDDVLSDKRGDPDDINALFLSMLKGAKVDADLVLLATKNYQTLIAKFPNLSQFSRVIVRVNLKDGAVFADAADAAVPFGDLPWFEKGISGMVVEGSKLVPTPIPQGTSDENVSETKVAVQLNGDWKEQGDIEVNLKGSPAADLRGELIGEPLERAEQDLIDYFGFGHGDVTLSNLTHTDLKDASQAFLMKAHLEDQVGGGGGAGTLLLNPWMGDQFHSPVFKSAQRQSYIQFQNLEKRVTTSTWKLAPEIQVEKLPGEVNLRGDLADFSHSCTQNQDVVTCTRTYIVKKTNMTDPNSYRSIKAFFDEVAQHDQEVIVLRK